MSIGTAVSIRSDVQNSLQSSVVEFVNNYDNGNTTTTEIQLSNRTVALRIVSCVSGVVLAVVAIVGFVLLRRKVSNNRFSELKYIFSNEISVY